MTDVTEVRWGDKIIEERAYFTCIYYLFSGKVFGHKIDKHSTVKFTTDVLKQAVNKIPKDIK